MTSTSTRPSAGTLGLIVLGLLALLVLGPVLAMGIGMPVTGGMGWWMHDGTAVGMAPWWGLGVGLVWLVLLVGVGYVVYRAVAAPGDDDPALEELRLAYARGDLTEEEFEERRAVLNGDRSP